MNWHGDALPVVSAQLLFDRIADESMESHRVYLQSAITEYVQETNSEWGQYILENFNHFQRKIWMVKPKAAEFDSLLDTLQSNAA